MEIPFVFNRFELLGDMDRFMFEKNTLADRDALSRTMGTYWANFARTGTPASVNGLNWPAYAEGGEALMRLDSAKDGGVGLIQGSDSFEAILADLKSDKRLSQKKRCRLGAGLVRFVPDTLAALGCGA